MDNVSSLPQGRRLAFLLIVCGTVLGIAGTDLVLPAVPSLPATLGGTPAQAQLVLSAYVAGTAVGLLGFGELGARLPRRRLLTLSLGLFALASLAAAFVSRLDALIAVRVVQGAFGAAAAVFAPGLIRTLYGEAEAVGALGKLGSIEALTPALAPIAGAALLAFGGWRAAFALLAVLALVAAVAIHLSRAPLASDPSRGAKGGGYLALLRNGVFLRYALSQAFSLGGLLVFVFGAPAVLTGPLGLSIAAFITLQIIGVATFILAANLSGRLSVRWGAERLIQAGTAAELAGFAAILVYAVSGGRSLPVVAAGWMVVNLGFGCRGPVGFNAAIVAAEGDETRGAALVVLGLLATAAIGTAIVAPFVTTSLVPLAGAGTAIVAAAVTVLACLPPLPAVDGAAQSKPH